MDDWFTIDQVDKETHTISEYRHWEETHCYLLNGSRYSLLIDTGLGICNIHNEVSNLVRFGSGTDIYAPWAGVTAAPVAPLWLRWCWRGG
jgi:hypothetical protein